MAKTEPLLTHGLLPRLLRAHLLLMAKTEPLLTRGLLPRFLNFKIRSTPESPR